jgi:hypothetical protein
MYQAPAPDTNSFEKPSPMLGNDYSAWDYGQGQEGFSEFSSMQNVLKDYAYQPPIDTNMISFSGINSSTLMQSSYLEDPSFLGMGLAVDETSPRTVYSGRRSTSAASIDQRAMNHYDMSNSQGLTRSIWWPESNRDVQVPDYATPSNPDALPGYHPLQQSQQPYGDRWDTGSTLSGVWPSHPLTSTISPNVLSLDISTPLSLSGSSQGSMLQISDSSSSGSSDDDQSECSSPESLAVVKPRRPRQILPDSGPSFRRMLPILTDDEPSSRSAKKRPKKTATTSTSNSLRKSSAASRNVTVSHVGQHTIHKRIEPKPVETSSVLSSSTGKNTHCRDAKDDFLIRSKLAGMSYKDIRRKGKFAEAESTLRGRFRTLTKHKTARVRKPEWNDNDVGTAPPPQQRWY